MALPRRELQPFTITRGDFLYKTADSTEWIRLRPPIGERKHNCYGIKFDSGVILTQTHDRSGCMCEVKLILQRPILKPELGQQPNNPERENFTIEAECVEFGKPIFKALPGGNNEARSFKFAKRLPLALLDKPITAVLLRKLSKIREGEQKPDDHEVRDRILALIDLGCPKIVPAQTNGSQPDQNKQHPAFAPGPSDGWRATPIRTESKVKLDNGRQLYVDGYVKQRLDAHHATTAHFERRLREYLEKDRKAMLEALLQAITATFNMEWWKNVQAQVACYRTHAASAAEKIIEEGKRN